MLRCHSPFPKKGSKVKTKIKRIPPNELYIQLKEKKKNVKPKSDCRPPILKTDTYIKPYKLIEDYKRCIQLAKDNLELMSKINRIQRTKGRTENFRPNEESNNERIQMRLAQIKLYEQQNLALEMRFRSASGKLPTCKQLLQDWKKNLEAIKYSAKYPIILPDLTEEDYLSKEAANSNRPLVFLNLAQKNGRPLGKLIIIIFNDVVPNLAMNFIKLCENAKAQAEESSKKLPHLLGTSLYRIFPGLYLEVGDMVHENGCGGMSAEGEDFIPDNFLVDHDCIGTLAMTPNSEGKVNSLFTISFKPLRVLNGKRAAFGRVIKGLNILDAIQSFGSKNGKPKLNIVITNCGLLNVKS